MYVTHRNSPEFQIRCRVVSLLLLRRQLIDYAAFRPVRPRGDHRRDRGVAAPGDALQLVTGAEAATKLTTRFTSCDTAPLALLLVGIERFGPTQCWIIFKKIKLRKKIRFSLKKNSGSGSLAQCRLA
jgi:hypothetical protein